MSHNALFVSRIANNPLVSDRGPFVKEFANRDMRIRGSHMVRGMIVMVGIFAVLVMSMVVPQLALSQLASPSGTNQSSSAETNIPSNATKLIIGPGGLLDGGLVVQDPSGDDRIYKNCIYKSRVYSPGSVETMPGGPKICRSDGTWTSIF